MDDNASQQPFDAPKEPRSAEEIREFIADWVCGEVEIDREMIEFDQPVTAYGIDSIMMVKFVAKFEEWLGCRFDENPFEEDPTIEEVATYLSERSGQGD